MQIDRRTFLLASLAASACARRNDDDPLPRAARFLWAQQAADGGFHSTSYGLLRSGQSLTPLVLGALLRVPGTIVPRSAGAVDRALAFITAHTNADGAVGRMEATAEDYPNYATALTISAFVRTGSSGWSDDIASMVAQLRMQQFSEANGWEPQHPAYGGWGMGGPIHRPPDAGHVDLSMTRFVLEALRASGVPASDAAMARALVFLDRSQNPDGGFYFSPVNPGLNKAGETGAGFASYGTATADGVLALRASGVPESDDRIVKGVQWLESHHQADRAPGFGDAQDSWSTGLRFYYASAIAHALPGLPVQLPPQAHDGSFRNANSLVKEDDPLIATAFAVHVLARPT